MRVLFLTTVLPSGRRGGGEVVSQGIVDALRHAGHEVAVLGWLRPGSAAGAGEAAVGTRPIETSAAPLRSLGWMARALAAGAPYSSAKYRGRAYAAAVRDALGRAPDALVADHAQVHFALDGASEGLPPLVFVAHNAEAAMYAQLAAEAGGGPRALVFRRESRLIGAAEAELARRAAQVWALTEDDAGELRGRCPDADVRALAVASAFEQPRLGEPPLHDVALLGNWTWGPNASGLEWFTAEVAPLLDGLAVAVGGPGSERVSAPRMSGHGRVADPGAFLGSARVVAVPSLGGGGVQVKTLDALAAGVPVVATPGAVRGLAGLPESLSVAAEPGDFARELVRLARCGDAERRRLGDEAAAWSRARRERFAAAVAGWLDELAPGARTTLAVAAEGSAGPSP